MFFNTDKRVNADNVQLVSLHIPKTAGTSFRNILKSVYGDDRAVRFDIKIKTRKIDIEMVRFEGSKLPGNIVALHGHFHYQDIVDQVRIPASAKWITWLREPSDRVMSNYFYLSERLREELDEERRGLNILAKMQRSLLEFARDEINRNRMSKFLAGADLETFDFIGLQEEYEKDLERLAVLLGWESYPNPRHNVTRNRPGVDPEVIAEIRELNSQDYSLYAHALKWREKHANIFGS
jgi:hypothetical protein